MTIIHSSDYPFCGTVRGRLGSMDKPNKKSFWGIYQQRKCSTGYETIKEQFYKPTNPNSPLQQYWRKAYAQSVHAWKDLTMEARAVYNLDARRLHMSGYNLFQRKFLLSFRVGRSEN